MLRRETSSKTSPKHGTGIESHCAFMLAVILQSLRGSAIWPNHRDAFRPEMSSSLGVKTSPKHGKGVQSDIAFMLAVIMQSQRGSRICPNQRDTFQRET